MAEDFSAWVGKSETRTDRLDPLRSNTLLTALGEDGTAQPGGSLPLLHHWLYFWDVRPPTGLGPDGHPARGGFLPPVSLPRRMWAGGRVKFLAPLHLEERVTRTSTIRSIEAKSGKSGDLVFVMVEHQIAGEQGVAIIEEQDIVYREAAAPGSISAPKGDVVPEDAAIRHVIEPDPVLLFRYSALTMNSHRIHYDAPYAEQEEAYPGLVVHGPLQATLMAKLARENLDGALADFDFRGQAPAFGGAQLHICGALTDTGIRLWTSQGGATNMIATARTRES